MSDSSLPSQSSVELSSHSGSHPPAGRLTGRALFIGALGAAGIGLLAPWAVHVVRGGYLALEFSTPGAVGLMFLLVAGPNLLVLRLRRRLALSTAELIIIYSMMIVASAIPTTGVTAPLIPLISGPYYYANPANRWAELVTPHIAPWLVPRGAGLDSPVTTDLYEGLPAGSTVPWGAWVTPLAAWLAFLLSLHLVMMCMMVLLRKQWVENERLSYPLTYLPLALAGAGSGGRPAILRNPLFWMGMAIPVVVGSLKGLHYYFPSVPTIELHHSVIVAQAHLPLLFIISFALMGFFYLVPLDTTFSLWFFSLLAQATRFLQQALGIFSQEYVSPGSAWDAYFQYLGGGAFLALVATNLWVARGHLHTIWQRVVGRAGPEVDSRELISYPTAFWGMIVGLLIMGGWLVAAGLPPVVVPIFLVIAMVIFLALTRVVVEGGVAMAHPPVKAAGLTAGLLGWDLLGNRGIVVLTQAFIWSGSPTTFVMCSAANSLKMTDVIRERHRRLWGGFWLAIVVALATSIWLTMTRAYLQGGITLHDNFFISAIHHAYRWTGDWNTRQPGHSTMGLVVTSAGAAIFLFLSAMRFRFLQWPFHPIGFALGPTQCMKWLWLPAFLIWLVKSAILRYGGMRLYDTVRPLFLGLICGQYSIVLIWVVIDWLTGHTGNWIYTI